MSESEQRLREALTEPCAFGAVMLENGSFTKADLRELLRLLDEAREREATFHMDYRIKCDVETKALHNDLARVTAERDERRKHADLVTHKLLACGVAATHPDANLTRTGVYVAKWDSGQAEDVRKLRADRDALAAKLARAERALRDIASCTSTFPGDVVSIAQTYFVDKQEPRT